MRVVVATLVICYLHSGGGQMTNPSILTSIPTDSPRSGFVSTPVPDTDSPMGMTTPVPTTSSPLLGITTPVPTTNSPLGTNTAVPTTVPTIVPITPDPMVSLSPTVVPTAVPVVSTPDPNPGAITQVPVMSSSPTVVPTADPNTNSSSGTPIPDTLTPTAMSGTASPTSLPNGSATASPTAEPATSTSTPVATAVPVASTSVPVATGVPAPTSSPTIPRPRECDSCPAGVTCEYWLGGYSCVTSASPGSSSTSSPAGVPAPSSLQRCGKYYCNPGAVCVPIGNDYGCVPNRCLYMQCPFGQACLQTSFGATCKASVSDPCKDITCNPGERCLLGSSNEATCTTVVSDPCKPCRSDQNCLLAEGGLVECVDVDSCNSRRRQIGLTDCSKPTPVCQMVINYPKCLKKEQPASCNSCARRGMACNSNGECIDDQCSSFVWPPVGVQLCGSKDSCPVGMKCTGCTLSSTCDSATGEVSFGNNCQPTCERSYLLCNTTTRSSWTTTEQRDCCPVLGIGCSQYNCLNSNPVEEWSSDQKLFCCLNAGKGCTRAAGEFECSDGSEVGRWSFEKQDWCCKNKQIGCSAGYDCNGYVDPSWTTQRLSYCCRKVGKGCSATNGYNCVWSNDTSSPWNSQQKEWCCRNKGVNCPPKDPYTCTNIGNTTFDIEKQWCCANKNIGCKYICQQKWDLRRLWSEDQRKYCCLYDGIGCKANKVNFDCFDISFQWGKQQKDYCCREHDAGCSVDCSAETIHLTPMQSESCCNRTGLHCEVGRAASPQTPTANNNDNNNNNNGNSIGVAPQPASIFYQIKFHSNRGRAMRNPRRAVRKFRMSLLLASPTLRSNPSMITVRYFGALVLSEFIPTGEQRSRWGLSIPAEWNNASPLPTEAVSSKRSVQTLSETMNEVLQTTDKDGMFFEFTLNSESSSEIDSIENELTTAAYATRKSQPTGPFMSNCEGYCYILPAAEFTQVKAMAAPVTPSPTLEDDDGILWTVLWGIFVFLCIIIIALYVRHELKKKKENQDGDSMRSFSIGLCEDMPADHSDISEDVSEDSNDGNCNIKRRRTFAALLDLKEVEVQV